MRNVIISSTSWNQICAIKLVLVLTLLLSLSGCGGSDDASINPNTQPDFFSGPYTLDEVLDQSDGEVIGNNINMRYFIDNIEYNVTCEALTQDYKGYRVCIDFISDSTSSNSIKISTNNIGAHKLATVGSQSTIDNIHSALNSFDNGTPVLMESNSFSIFSFDIGTNLIADISFMHTIDDVIECSGFEGTDIPGYRNSEIDDNSFVNYKLDKIVNFGIINDLFSEASPYLDGVGNYDFGTFNCNVFDANSYNKDDFEFNNSFSIKGNVVEDCMKHVSSIYPNFCSDVYSKYN